MKVVKIIAAVVIGLIAAWFAIVPYFVGVRTEAETRDELDKLAQGLVWGNATGVRLDSYERGWFFSSAIIVYSVPVGPKVVKLVVTEHINQLAIPFYRWLSTNYDVAVQNDNGVSMALKVDAHSVKSFSGVTTLDIHAPNLNWTGPGLDIQGRDIVAQLSGKKDQEQHFSLSAASLSWSSQLTTADQTLFTVDAQDIHVSGTEPDGKLALSNWSRQTHVEAGSIRLLAGSVQMLKSDKATFDYEVKDQGSGVDLLYRTHAEKAALGGVKTLEAKDAHFDFSYSHLDKAGLLKLQAALKAMQMRAAAAKGRMPPVGQMPPDQLAGFKQASMELARHSPGFQIQRLGFKTPNGGLEGNLALRFNGDKLPPNALEQPEFLKTLLERGSGKAALRISRNLILHSMAALANPQAPNDQTAVMQQQLLDAKIKAMVDQGMLKEQGADLVVEASFDKSGMQINGKHENLHGPTVAGMPAQASAPASVALNPVVPATGAVPVKPALASSPAIKSGQPAMLSAGGPTQPSEPSMKRPVKHRLPRHVSDKNADARSCLALSGDRAVSACAERY